MALPPIAIPRRVALAILTLVALGGVAYAQLKPKFDAPDIPLPDRDGHSDVPKLRFVTVTADMSAHCGKPGAICFSIAPDMPMRISRLVGTPFGEIALYRRSPLEGDNKVDARRPWEIQFVGNLNPRSLKGNLMFIVYDREDPTAAARHAFVAMWESNAPSFRFVAARALLDPESDGFHAGHTYLLRLVQQWNQREVVLAQSTFRLE